MTAHDAPMPQPRPRRVLVVEDETVVQLHLRHILTDLGYEVTGTAVTADEALSLAAAEPPDAVLMDVQIPGGRDGIETARELRARHGVPVVFVTAYADDATVARIEALGAAGYVIKPFRPAEIRLALSTALRGREVVLRLEEQARSLTSILGTVADGLVAVDRTGRITHWTPQAAALTGWPEDAALGRSVHEVLRPASDDDGASFRRTLGRTLDAGRSEPLLDLGFLDRDGGRLLLCGETTPIPGPDGAAGGIVLALRAATRNGTGYGESRAAADLEDERHDDTSDHATSPGGAGRAGASLQAAGSRRRRAADAPGRRVLIYSHDTFGLGHLRRSLNITSALLRRDPRFTILIATGSPVAHRFPLPAGADYLKLPAVKKVASERYEARSLDVSDRDILRLRTNLLLRTARDFEPDLFLVDHSPLGMSGEVLPALEWLACNTDCVRVLGLRDIVDAPERVVPVWQQQGIYDVLENLYDHLLVYGMQEVFDPIAAYRLPPGVASKTRFMTYVTDDDGAAKGDRESFLDSLPRPLVVVTIGGGDGAGETVIGNWLEMLRRHEARVDFWSVVLPGPLMPREEAARFAAMAEGLPVTLREFVPSTRPYVRRSDLVVCTGGYNTIAQVLDAAPRALVVPRLLHREEQLLRARRLAALGLVDYVHPEEVDPDRLFVEVKRQLASTAAPLREGRARGVIHFEGASRVAAFCGEAVGLALADAGG